MRDNDKRLPLTASASSEKLDGAGIIGGEERGVEVRLLLGGAGIKVAAHTLHAVVDVPGVARRRALEEHMLHEMRHAIVLRPGFVARAAIHHKAAVHHRRLDRAMHDAEPIGKSNALV